MIGTEHKNIDPVLALSARQVADQLGVSERHVWSLDSSGRLPRPVRLGKSVRWPTSELKAWLAAGSPARDQWEGRRRKE